MYLSELLDGLTRLIPTDVTVSAITNDSRKITPQTVFFAQAGLRSHGLDYLRDECLKGKSQPAAVVYEPPYDLSRFACADNWIAIPSLSQHMSEIGRRFYQPIFDIAPIGVTGTNGKTSVTQYIAQLADFSVIGTMGYGRLNGGASDALTALSHTTPDALAVQAILAELSQQSSGVAMEVSSHALALHRVSAVDFGVAVFTNLTQDHLDFHGDMAQYFLEKAKLFMLPTVHTAIINVDGMHDNHGGESDASDASDASDVGNYGARLAAQVQAAGKCVWVYGESDAVLDYDNAVRLTDIQLSANGISVKLQRKTNGKQWTENLTAPVWGRFNAHNLVAAMLALQASGFAWAALLNKTASIRGVTGRIDPIHLPNGGVAVIDYAHTPDALIRTLQSLREQVSGKIIAVFGCGGDRDKGKRPLMAAAVEAHADAGIITDDNPRTESSADIIADIWQGVENEAKFTVVASRKTAICAGLAQLQAGDVLLIAGKGHETYQIIGDQTFDFSDYAVVAEWLVTSQETRKKCAKNAER
ncbi:UDP-N-acetylmuramoyl-L-alanyl-D-glutamate--2,6-diaminopimelate ligase [Ostreibacterium oceani]|uniref:UDP-N-acetylmuramoyl-L-alanyl-D-glutamate--2,6-diaminopimelate ligase n=1 Tax=Ostreibacterium oceani TaxID=2654998 RepID=A0A6N7F0F7_9GAMM|nr:UDP-N-acetylmuramoyl-L-alanyl-D-glutamate--2,6-diaminopimelate ligase [Ostreibacterium oceani]MPV86268.1 UDP-N-acetylmuramoyl-L-alanyl-D-glutamate--2,6-diaminopimelate ligase [Ostreibacterium oceani]